MYCIVTGLEFATSSERDEAYGLDSPEALAWESQCNFEEACIADQDAMEAAGGPVRFAYANNEIPF